MPVIDVHMHAGFTPEAEAAMQAMMDSLDVRHAIYIGTEEQLESLPPSRRSRLLPALTFPCEDGRLPNAGVPCFRDGGEFPDVDALRSALAGGRIAALGEVNAQYAGISPEDSRLEPYWGLAEEFEVPVGIHMGIGPPGVAYVESRFPPRKSPNYRGSAGDLLRLEEVLVRHPRMRLYVMHAGWPMLEGMTYLLYMHPQVYVDVAVLQYAIPRAAFYSYLGALVEAGFGKRIMYGSDG